MAECVNGFIASKVGKVVAQLPNTGPVIGDRQFQLVVGAAALHQKPAVGVSAEFGRVSALSHAEEPLLGVGGTLGFIACEKR
jgi:hypothetical protein